MRRQVHDGTQNRLRVIVVGSGIIGACTAHRLAGLGHDVTLVDEGKLNPGASVANAGWIVPSMAVPVAAPGMIRQAAQWMLRPDSPLYVQPTLDPRFLTVMFQMLSATRKPVYDRSAAILARLSGQVLEDYHALQADGVEFDLSDLPLTTLFTDEKHLMARAEELRGMSALGTLEWQSLDRAQVSQVIPGASANVVGALRTVGDRVLDPPSLMRALLDACVARGVEFLAGTATLTTSDGGRVVAQVGGDRLRANAFVVAAGVWSNTVIKPLGVRLPIVAGKGYGYDLPLIEGFSPGPLYLSEGKVAVTPLSDRIRLAGTMGFGRPDNVAIVERRAQGILRSARKFLSNIPVSDIAPRPFIGLRPMTPDGIPLISRLRRHPEVIVATGHQMLGITLGPTTGRIVAEMVDGGLPAPDPLVTFH